MARWRPNSAAASVAGSPSRLAIRTASSLSARRRSTCGEDTSALASPASTRARSGLSASSRVASASSSRPTWTGLTIPLVISNPRPSPAWASTSGEPVRLASSPACW